MDGSSLPRLAQQTIRNAIAEACVTLRADQQALRWGVDEFFEMWGALFPYDDDGVFVLHPNSAISDTERAALLPLVDVLNRAAEVNSGSPEAFLKSPLTAEINRAADLALATMRERGRFSEQLEEEEPSLPFS